MKLRDKSALIPLVERLVVRGERSTDTVKANYAAVGIFNLGLRAPGKYRVEVSSLGYQATFANVRVRTGRQDSVLLDVEQEPLC